MNTDSAQVKTPSAPPQSPSPSLSQMVNTKVETVARLAQWKIESFDSTILQNRSDPFKIGLWNWCLTAEKSKVNKSVYIQLIREPSGVPKEQLLVAQFVLRVTAGGSNRMPYVSPVLVKRFHVKDYSACTADIHWQGQLVIDIEFLELSVYSKNDREGTPVGHSKDMVRNLATQSSLLSRMINESVLARMLNESILADITINTADGKLQAHKAILSATSPVFYSMFMHDLKEKESSTINIEDMTSDSCKALLSYFYGTINQGDFWEHRLALLAAADKYDIIDLKDACEESLLEDVDSGNVLERLQEAWLYKLGKLKRGCLMYLLDFGKIYDVREEMKDFLRNADRELVVEMFQELVAACKPTEAASFLTLLY